MPSPSWENLDVFLQLDDNGGFGVTAMLKKIAHTPPAGAGWKVEPRPADAGQGAPDTFMKPLAGIFDDPYLNTDLGEYEADTSAPRFTCKASDVVGIVRGDWLLLDGKAYSVMTRPQEDGTGMATLRLES